MRMQDRYTGDIGDFSKLGLLRALQAVGLSIGLNWYLTPDETHNGDGRHVGYLRQDEFRTCDEELWLALRNIVDSGNRRVEQLENEHILEATFFHDRLNFAGKAKPERARRRHEWFARSLATMAERDLVFVDPDNGLIVPSATGRPKEIKYVLRDELASYYSQGSSVVYYQHKARRKDGFYIQQHNGLVGGSDFPDATGLILKFTPVSQRYYMFIIQPQHRVAIKQAVNGLLSTDWSKYFQLL